MKNAHKLSSVQQWEDQRRKDNHNKRLKNVKSTLTTQPGKKPSTTSSATF